MVEKGKSTTIPYINLESIAERLSNSNIGDFEERLLTSSALEFISKYFHIKIIDIFKTTTKKTNFPFAFYYNGEFYLTRIDTKKIPKKRG